VHRRTVLLPLTVVLLVTAALSFSSVRAQAVSGVPAAPGSLSMALQHSQAALLPHTWVNQPALVLRFGVTVLSGPLTPQVELEPTRVRFTGQPNLTAAPMKASGQASVLVSGLQNRTTYHWQARTIDASGDTSPWVRFGGASGGMAFGVDLDAPSKPTLNSPTNPLQSRWYNTKSELITWHDSDAGSGIAGYSLSITHNPGATPPDSLTRGTSVRLTTLGDGVWYVALRAQDQAGNWSPTSEYRLQLDRTQPQFAWLSPKKIVFNPYRGATQFKFRTSKPASVKLQLFRVGQNKPVSSRSYPHVAGNQVVTMNFSGKGPHGVMYPAGYYFFHASVVDRASNTTHENVGGIQLNPGKPVMSPAGELVWPDGGKVIFVSLAHEALYAYDGTKLVLQTLVTTGNPSLPTPPGQYTVMQKFHPYEFISPWPEGSPYYYAPSLAQYALLFRDGGYFLHDAPWRSEFGPGTNGPGQPGTNYGGTHGCVNIPSTPMVFLFGWATVGTPVDVVP
jgi:hypothetical protein